MPGARRRGLRRVGSARAVVAGRDHPHHPRLARHGLAGHGGDHRAGERRPPPTASTSSAAVRRSGCSAGCAPARANDRCWPGRSRRRSSATPSSRRRRPGVLDDVADGRRIVAAHGVDRDVHPRAAVRLGRLGAALRLIDEARTTSSGWNSTCWCTWASSASLSASSSSAAVRPSKLAGLAHRAERHRGGAGELDVVVADDRQLAGHVDAHRRHLLEQPEGEEVVGAERRRRATGAGSPASRSPARRPSATLSAAVSRTSSVSADGGRLHGLPRPLEPVGRPARSTSARR